MSIRSSTVVNRSAAVMSRNESVDESCRHRRSIVRHRTDAGNSQVALGSLRNSGRYGPDIYVDD